MKGFFNKQRRKNQVEETKELDFINLDETAGWSKLDIAHRLKEQNQQLAMETAEELVPDGIRELTEIELEEGREAGELTVIELEEGREAGELTEIELEKGREAGELVEIELEEGREVGELAEIELEEESKAGELTEIDLEEESKAGELVEIELEEEREAGELTEMELEEETETEKVTADTDDLSEEDIEYLAMDEEEEEEELQAFTLEDHISDFFARFSTIDKIIAATGVCVLLLAMVTGGIFLGKRTTKQQVEALAPIGEQLENVGIIGEDTLLAVADARKAMVETAWIEEELLKEYEEVELSNEVKVTMKLTSVQKDLKIKFVNQKSGKLIGNVLFEVRITEPDGKAYTKKDEDKDGIIYLTDLNPGNYTVAMVELADMGDYSFSTAGETIKVKESIDYQKIDVSDEIKSESQVNIAQEDTAVKVETEATLTDTVEWVESTKTETGSESTYIQINKSDIGEPSQAARLLLSRSFYRTSEVSTGGEAPKTDGGTADTPTSSAADTTTSSAPDSSQPSTPDSSEPSAPDSSEPSTPDISEPSTPDSSQPSTPDSSQPSTPDSSEPSTPDSSQPSTPDSSEPSTPDSSQPSTPDSSQPSTPDSSQPSTPDSSQPSTPDSSKPSTPDSSQPSTPDSGKPDNTEKPGEIAVTEITLSQSALTLEVGKTTTIVAAVKPDNATNKAVTWSSSDNTIAKVDDKGAITAVKAGTVKITAKAGDKSASCTVTVTAKAEETKVTLDRSSVSLKTGEALTLNATVTPAGKPLSWSSSNSAVATVDNGKVTAKAAGEATITVTAEGKSATCVVKVSASYNPQADTSTALKAKDGSQVYYYANGQYIEAKVADYYKYDTFYKKATNSQYKYTGWQNLDGKTYYFDKNGNKVTGEQVIQGAKYTFNSDGSLHTGSGILGIDVSTWNGNIDWQQVKNAGVSYVIIRTGFRGSTQGALVEDAKFRQNIQGATNAGLKVGVYFFTQAVNEVEAVEEASMVLSQIKNYKISYPVFIDVESSGGRADGLDAATRTRVINAFCQTIQNAGYRAGIYANKTWLNQKMNISALSGYKIWLAQYNTQVTYGGRYDMWQYSDKGKIPGISTNVDMNLSYMNY